VLLPPKGGLQASEQDGWESSKLKANVPKQKGVGKIDDKLLLKAYAVGSHWGRAGSRIFDAGEGKGEAAKDAVGMPVRRSAGEMDKLDRTQSFKRGGRKALDRGKEAQKSMRTRRR